MNKLIFALCLSQSTKVAGFASYSGKDCILASGVLPARIECERLCLRHVA